MRTCIEEPQKSNPSYRAAECFAECLEEYEHLLFLLLFFFIPILSFLPLRKRFPRKVSHFLISRAEQTNVVKHFSEEAGDICSSAETKHEDVVVNVSFHQKLIPTHDMLVERSTDSRIFCFQIPWFEPRSHACMRKRSSVHVRANAWLVVVLISIVSIKHSIYLQDVTISVGA